MLALEVKNLSFRYGTKDEAPAVDDLSLDVQEGEIFALLGPNGSGKSTLFRLISTLAPIQQGELRLFGSSVAEQRSLARAQLGVVFQSPSLDPKLTVLENIRCQGALYGLPRKELAARIEQAVTQLGLQERLDTKADELSGGLKRRVELAKGILHSPRLLLMDEPSTGLDPASRLDLWHAIQLLREESGVTVLLTTHLLEEADKADRIAIMDRGKTVAVGKPAELRASLGGQLLDIQSEDLSGVSAWLEGKGESYQQVEQVLRVTGDGVANLVVPLSNEFGTRIQTLTLGQPSLEDVFVAKTGHRFWNERQADSGQDAKVKSRKRKR